MVLTLLAATVTAQAALSSLHVTGNQILNEDNKPVLLRGVNVASLEWSPDGENHVLKTTEVAIKDWHANIIRFPLSQDRWFGKADNRSDDGKAYQALVHKVVDYCSTHGCYALLDLHWNDAGEWGANIGQHAMPDMNSVDFWKSCAPQFANKPAVLFDLYNEPHDIAWVTWRDGGQIKETKGPGARQGPFVPVSYQSPGMQALLNTVRNAGANNVLVAGGLDWSYDLSGFLTGYALTDTARGHGVIYACHCYPFKGDKLPQFLTKLDAALPSIPVIVSEFGAENRPPSQKEPNEWITGLLTAMALRNCNWIAWDLHPAAGPRLLKDWSYNPTESFGVPVKSALTGTIAH